MVFQEKYPDMKPGDAERDCIIRVEDSRPCIACGRGTKYIEICTDFAFCSEECLHKYIDDMME